MDLAVGLVLIGLLWCNLFHVEILYGFICTNPKIYVLFTKQSTHMVSFLSAGNWGEY